MTVLELITASMRRLGYLEATETPSSADSTAAMDAFNAYIDALSLDGMMIYRVARHTFNLVAGTASYTIGSGGDFDVARPVWIERCGVLLDPSATSPIERPLGRPLTAQQYAAIVSKGQTSDVPAAVYYDPAITSGFGIIRPWPVPSSSTPDLVLYLPEVLTEFAAVGDTLTLARGYRRFLILNGALEIAPIFGAVPTPDLVAQAREAKADVQIANARVEELTLPAGTPGAWTGLYDIERG